MKDKEQKFLNYLNEDVKALKQGIKEVSFELNKIIDSCRENEFSFSIDFKLFKDLTNEYCYHNIGEIKQVPTSIIPPDTEPKYVSLFFVEIPENRFNLFKDIFNPIFERISIKASHNSITTSPFFKEEFYYRFFYALFHEYFQSKKNIEVIFYNLINQWRNAIKTNKTTIILKIEIDGRYIKENLIKHEKFKFIRESIRSIYSVNPYMEGVLFYNWLVYYAEISFNIKDPSSNNESIWQEYQKIYEDLTKFMCALYLNGINVKNTIPVIELPWWYETNYSHRIRFNDIRDTRPLFYGYKEGVKFTEEVSRNVFKDYLKLIEKGFFDNDYFPLQYSFKKIAFKAKTDINIIFDTLIILEYLFAPGELGEFTFRISLNTALFLSENLETFIKFFHFFKCLYDIRNSAIHGGDWLKKIHNVIKKLQKNGVNINNLQEIFYKMEKYLKLIIKKILQLPISISQFKNTIKKNPVYFIENSEIFKKK